MDHLKKSFDSFFDGEAKVAVIKGEWGVGKTYFWEKYISTRIHQKNLSQIAYSYISLFGKSSLDDVRKSIFHSAKSITTDSKIEESFEQEFKESSSLFNKIPWLKDGVDKAQRKAPFLSRLLDFTHKIPYVDKFSSMLSSLEYGLVKNYVVCFDDMERKGKGLSVKEVMGLIDELVQRKNCKVVLIFNESCLDDKDDQKQFELYREKIVDIELNHNPSCKENLECVFPADTSNLSIIENTVNELNIKNIRVLRKLKWMNERFAKYFDGRSEQIKEEYLLHATVLCSGFYIKDNELTYDLLKKQLASRSWLSFFSDKDKEISLGEKKYRSIASNLKLSTSKLDAHISFFLEQGYLDDEPLRQTINELEEYFKVNFVSAKLRAAWDIYSESFADNVEDFKNALKAILKEEMPRLGLSDFSSAIDILEEFGEDVSGYISRYIDIHSEALKKTSRQPSIILRFSISNKNLMKQIEKLQEESKSFNIDDVSMKIAGTRGWNPEDVDFLSSLSKDDFKKWMKSSPEDLYTKIKGGLFFFRNLGTSNEVDQKKYGLIADNVVEALKEIASENDFNKKRIKNLYEVE
ncbi:MAG: P-loop NTPase fold protein [Desulfobacterales bacterium]